VTDSNALTIHPVASQNEGIELTPLEELANNMEQTDHLKKMKALLQSAFNDRPSRRRDSNFTIVQKKQEEQPLQQD
jgi:hypothetical protein